MNQPATQTRNLPYLTAEDPGVGGTLKKCNEDFVVDELPRYAASGEGTHTYLWIEKRGVTTLDAIYLIADALGKHPRDVGYAGMKDAHGVTRQWVSIEHVDPARIEALNLNRIRILSVTRHTNKIKLGHLSGNRFDIRIRHAGPGARDQAAQIMAELERRGVPNYFGPQRFGTRGDNAAIGRAVLRGNYDEAVALVLGRPTDRDTGTARSARERFDAGDLQGSIDLWGRGFRTQSRLGRALMRERGHAKRAWRTIPHTVRKLYVSAVQSELFNRVLAERIAHIDGIEQGDIAMKHANGACFAVEDADTERPRCATFEISPTGPLFGRLMKIPTGRPADIEQRVLETSGFAREEIRALDGSRLDGARRALRVPMGDPSINEGADERGPFLRVSFTLPAGAYATTLLREVCKNDAP